MLSRNHRLTLTARVLLCLLILIPLSAAFVKEDPRIENLRAFAKVYGYVRFFHPSDEVAAVSWDKVAVHGATEVIGATNAAELKVKLEGIFSPLAATMEIDQRPLGKAPPLPGADSADSLRVVAWQHFGVRLSERSNIYKSVRVNRDKESTPLFEAMPRIGEAIDAELGRGLHCRVPLALYASDEGVLGGDTAAFESLESRLAGIDLNSMTADELAVRLADTVITWNVFQHFYPYFDVVDVDWEKMLDATLKRALEDRNAKDFFDTLSILVAGLEDGHGVVYFQFDPPRAVPPIRFERIENLIVVTAVEGTDKFQVGDVVLSIDGRGALEELKRRMTLISGSPQLREHRALNLFGVGSMSTEAVFELERGGKKKTVRIARTGAANMFFSYPEYDYPGVRKIDDGIYYINMRKLDRSTYEENLETLAAARGVIIDLRWGSNREVNMSEILPHMTEETIRSARWNIPLVIYPDRRDLEFYESSWPMAPKKPYWKGKKAILTSPPVVSSGETIMGIVEHFHLAEMVGRPTAGCNGNANYIQLPGGYQIMWTGMKVLKHDGSQHHIIGIRPGHPVERSIRAVRERRDEFLEHAIEIITR